MFKELYNTVRDQPDVLCCFTKHSDYTMYTYRGSISRFTPDETLEESVKISDQKPILFLDQAEELFAPEAIYDAAQGLLNFSKRIGEAGGKVVLISSDAEASEQLKEYIGDEKAMTEVYLPAIESAKMKEYLKEDKFKSVLQNEEDRERFVGEFKGDLKALHKLMEANLSLEEYCELSKLFGGFREVQWSSMKNEKSFGLIRKMLALKKKQAAEGK